MEELPRSARLVCWFNAWCGAAVAPDDLIGAVTGEDAAHSVRGVEDGSALPLLLAVGALRRAGATAATLALPAPGDPVGVAGPRGFSEAAVEAGEAAVFSGAGIGLVPSVVGSGVCWQAYPASSATTVPGVADAERSLREALVVAARSPAEPRWGPQVADAIAALRSSRPPTLPRSYSARADRLAALAMRCVSIVELADRAAPALVDLERAARHALVAAGSETPQQRASAGR